MASVGLNGRNVLSEVAAFVAHMPGVKKSVAQYARGIEERAKSHLGQHRDTGAARIEFEREDTDALVSLVDPAALSIEYGRAAGVDPLGRKQGRMEGLHILGREL